MNYCKERLILFFIVLLLLVNYSSVLPQSKDTLSVKITAIQVGNNSIDEAQWSDLKIKEGLPIYFSFESFYNKNTQVLYKIFVDGNLEEPSSFNNYYSIQHMPVGGHVFRVVPFTAAGIEGTPLVFSFNVISAVEEPVKESQNSNMNFLSNPILIYALAGVVLIQFALLIILFVNRKKLPKAPKEPKAPKAPKEDKNASIQAYAFQELNELKLNFKRVKEELREQKSENDYLKKKLSELELNVKDLENTNLNLVEQKIKLEESKYKLEALQTQKEDLFAMAIHDIKNPASAIRGYIELLKSYDLNATEQQEIMVSLVASSEDIVKLSQDMCTIIAKAKPEPKLIFSKTAVKSIVDSVCNQNASYAKAKKVILVNNCPTNLPDIKADSEKIAEALDNLVNNAIKFAPPDTKVEVISFLRDLNKKTVVIEVKDNGVGLTEDDLRKSFQKGAVLSAKPTGFEQSSGLGLWIVKKIIDEHDGKVFVESKLTVGSTFAFELPLAE